MERAADDAERSNGWKSLRSASKCQRLDCHVSTVPNELLCRIFEEYASNCTRDLYDDVTFENPEPRDTWTSVTKVCSHWRAVALADPHLWSTFSVDPGRLRSWLPGRSGVMFARTAVWLQRSGDVPLDVTIPNMDLVDESTLQALVVRSHRIKALRVVDIGRYIKIKAFESCEAPLLESLSISNGKPFDHELPLIFGGHFPSLRRLSICDIGGFGANKFTKLTHLRLHDRRYGFNGPSNDDKDLQNFLALLQSTPALVMCFFRACRYGFPGEPTPDFITHPTTRMVLPALRRISFQHCDSSFQTLVLRRLQLSCGQLSISIGPVGDIPSIIPPPSEARIPHLHNATVYEIDFDRYTALAVGSSSAVLLHSWSALFELPNPTFATQLRETTSFYAARELWLAGVGPGADADQWRTLFCEMHSLTKLVIRFHAEDGQDREWLHALRGLGDTGFPAPALHTLVCVVRVLSYDGIVQPLQHALKARDESGHRLALLSIICEMGVPDEVRADWEAKQASLQWQVDEVRYEGVNRPNKLELPEFCRDYPEFRAVDR